MGAYNKCLKGDTEEGVYAVMIEEYLERYVAELKIDHPELESAFRRVPRHRFLRGWYEKDESGDVECFGQRWRWRPFDPENPDPESLRKIYSDEGLLIRASPFPSSSSQPSLTALKLKLLDLKRGMKVLEIGTGSGYSTALIAEMVGDQRLVTSMDWQPDLIQERRAVLAEAGYGGIYLLAGDGFYGCKEHAPYDRIVIDIGCPDISPYWVDQLAPDGFMLVPLQHGGTYAPLTKIWRAEGKVLGRVVGISWYRQTIQGELHAKLWLVPPRKEKECKEYPLFPRLVEIYEGTKRRGEWLSYGFPYFLVLADSRAFYYQGLGLWDRERGVITIQHEKKKIRLCGDEKLYRELHEIYEQWRTLGEPKASDYQIEFIPMEQSSRMLQAEEGTGIWKINRKFYQQIVRLQPANVP